MIEIAKTSRKILKEDGHIQMWQESLEDQKRRHLFRYFVGSPEGAAQAFDTPHEAWERFQRLVGNR